MRSRARDFHCKVDKKNCDLFLIGEYHNVLSKVVTGAEDEVLQESKDFLCSEVVLYEFDGKNLALSQ